jgi:hypothetical protein
MTRRVRHIAALSLAAVLAVSSASTWLPGSLVQPANAQQGDVAANFMNPFPENDAWRGLVIGDYLAEGLLSGLADGMASESRLQLQRRHRAFPSLGRVDIEDDAKALDDMIGKDKIGIAVVMFGMSDRAGIRLANGPRLAVGQPDWRVQYAQRVDRIVRSLRRRGVAVYWVGLPMTRRSAWNEDVEAINEVLRERVLSAGARYIDAYKESGDENGQFSDRGPDISGKVVRLRDQDGFDFTPAGYRKLAYFIERQMKRDMNAAREERTIPLAGAEIEQKRINPEGTKSTAAAAADGTGNAGTSAATVKDARAAASPVTRALTPGASTRPADGGQSGSSDLKADNVRVSFKATAGGREEQVTIEIIRPPITQSVIQLMTRRDKGDKPSEVGDTLTDTLSNGLLVMRSVTPNRAGGGDRAGSRGVLTQQPFFIALAKGERLPSKPGRADDFRWPREDDIPPPPITVSAPAPISSPVPLAKESPAGARVPRPAPPRPRPARGEVQSAPGAGVTGFPQ